MEKLIGAVLLIFIILFYSCAEKKVEKIITDEKFFSTWHQAVLASLDECCKDSTKQIHILEFCDRIYRNRKTLFDTLSSKFKEIDDSFIVVESFLTEYRMAIYSGDEVWSAYRGADIEVNTYQNFNVDKLLESYSEISNCCKHDKEDYLRYEGHIYYGCLTKITRLPSGISFKVYLAS